MPTIPTHLLVRGADPSTVLRADDGLPILPVAVNEGETLVVALRRTIAERWRSDPVVLETHLPPPPNDDESGYVALAVLDGLPDGAPTPAGTAWGPAPATLPDRVGRRAAAWLDEWIHGAPAPVHRPAWSQSGWYESATAWITQTLSAAGGPIAGPIEIRRIWSISVLARVPTTAGNAWFKAVFPHFHHEPAVSARLSELVDGFVPRPIAVEAKRGWLLLEDGGTPVREVAGAEDAILSSIDQLVAAQDATRGHLSEFEALGCPRRPLSGLAGSLASALEDGEALAGRAIPSDRIATVVDWVAEHAAWLDRLDMGDVLVHGDFHPGNLLVATSGTRVIDWSDAAVTHPVMEIGAWFGEVPPALRPRGWEAWLSALSRFGPVEPLRDRERDAFAVACAYQLVSYAGILRGIEPANRYQLGDGFGGYWQDLDAHVPRAGTQRGTRSAPDSGMNEREGERPPIDESTYGGSASETGGLYDDAGPTRANQEGDTMSEEEERDNRPPEAPST